jgi:hypothetical protein
MTPAGFPHSDISGSKCACHSPKLFAACHVLLRLSAPRHPPSTLNNLTIKCLELMRSACLWPRRPLPRLTTRVLLLADTKPPSQLLLLPLLSLLLSMISLGRENLRCSLQKHRRPSRTSDGDHVVVVGLDRFELSTPRLSSVCSNQLSYRPSTSETIFKRASELSGN